MNRFQIFISLILSFISTILADNYMIIEDPSPLIVYDSYESRVNNNIFKSYSPFRIMSKNWEMGDGITTAWKVKYLDNIYFLLLDDKGVIDGKNYCGKISQFSATTVEGTWNTSVSTIILSGVFPGRKDISSSFNKSKGIPLFKYRGHFYLINDSKKKFGWSKASQWEKMEDKNIVMKEEILTDNQISKLTNRIEEVNLLYKKLFNHFNEYFTDSRTAPYWKIKKAGKVISFTLRGNRTTVANLEESSHYIVQDFLNILLGEPFSVIYEKGVITVLPEKNL